MEDLKLCQSDHRFMDLIWEHGPVSSGQLVVLAAERLGWKKSTSYTVLKKLCQRGFARNEGSCVTALILRQQVQAFESRRVVEQDFAGSLPGFLVSFLGDKKISGQEADELMALIESYRQEG